MDEVGRLRAELALRDEFLRKATRTLSDGVRDVARATLAKPLRRGRLEAKILHVQGMLEELRVIADPHAAVPLRRKAVELCDVMEHYFSQRRKHLSQGGTRLRVEREGSIRCRLDTARFESMLDELLSNALKYRRGQDVTVDMTVVRGQVAIAVTNHGSWIGPPPKLARFQRGETHRGRRSTPGFGIGLWLTRRLAEAHGGGLTIETTRAQTRAIISLPCSTKQRAQASVRMTLKVK